jgi:hypothetical protein
MDNKNPPMKLKKISGRVNVLMAVPYLGRMIYIRQIDKDMFEYLVSKTPIYSSWVEMKPRKGKKTLSKNDINLTAQLVLSGAMATIETLSGKKLDKETQEKVDIFEKSKEKVLNKKKVIN